MKRAPALVVAVLGSMLWAASAMAATESEPNDDIAHPSGPLRAGEVHQGAFSTARDHDWFVLYTNPSRQLDLAITKHGSGQCSTSLDARLLDADGRKVDSKTVDAGETDNIRQLTAPTPARYYLVLVTDCPPGTSGDPYSVLPVANGAVVTSSPAAAGQPIPAPAAVGEPNDDLVTAWGPLWPRRQYGGVTNSAGDRDWFVLYTRPGHALDVAITKVGAGCSSTLDARLLDGTGAGLRGSAVSTNETDHFRLVTPPAPARFYVELFDTCAGDAYQLTAGPAAAIDPGSPLAAAQPRPTRRLIAEPNDRFSRAFGPLRGGVPYGGSFRSSRDVDHAVLYTSRPGRLEISIVKVGRSCSSSIEARLFDPSGRLLRSGGPASDRIATMAIRARRPTAYVLRLFSGCRGDPYQVRVDPAAAVRRSPPPILSVASSGARTYTASGHLLRRLGLRRAPVCRRVRALLEVIARGRLVDEGHVRVRRDCSYSATLSARTRARTLVFRVRFRGHRTVSKLRRRRTVRVPRVTGARVAPRSSRARG